MPAKKWRGKWYADFKIDGVRVRKVSPVQTKRGAQEFEAELRSAYLTSMTSSDSAPPSPARVEVAAVEEKPGTQFREFAVEWLRVYAVTNNKPSEVVNKESALRVHLIPFFENRTLDSITPRDIERYKAEKLRDGGSGKPLSPKTVNNHLAILRKLLVTAEEWELIPKVPRVKKLSATTPKFEWLNAEESVRFLRAVEEHYPQWRALFYLALRTGMRRGEMFALHWEDVDFARGLITVRYSVFRGKLVTPKNGRVRQIPMTPQLAQVLKEHRRAMGVRSKLVLPAEDGKITTHQDHADRPLYGALRKAGLKRIRFHDLRHSFASQLVSAGRSIREVQELLGHQSIQMTMRYAHLAPERMRDAVLVLDQNEPQFARA